MIHRVIKPSEILKPYINYYYVLEVKNFAKFPSKQRAYPYGCIVLVFHYEHPFLFQKRNELAEIEPQTVICGQQTSYYDLSPAGKVGMIFVVFHPYGAGMFFKLPMTEIANQNLAFENIVNKEAREIEDKIVNAISIRERITIIEDYLINKLSQNIQDTSQILAAFNKIIYNNGQTSVKVLADTACLSIKQFERKFSSLIGLKPKQFLRIYRFQKVLNILNKKTFNNLTSLAYENGYYDQAHFIHDFKTFTGLTPKEFFKNQQKFS